MSYRFVFYVSEKLRSHQWGANIRAGAAVHGDIVEFIPKVEYKTPPDYCDGGGNLGLSKQSKRLMAGYLAAGKHFLFFDKGYFGRGEYWRVSVDGWQPVKYFQRFMRPYDRFDVFKLEPLDRNDVPEDGHIVFAGSCQNYANFFDLGNVNDYNLEVLKNIRANTDRLIIYRPNPSWYIKHNDEFRPIHKEVKNVRLSDTGSFTDILSECHLVVTHGTGAAVTAILNGVPSLTIADHSIARPISMGPNWGEIEDPVWYNSKVRQQFFADLAYCQWTVTEFRSGKAWEEIKLILRYLEKNKHEPQQTDIINQYQLMHASPKYFRGINTVNYRDEVGRLVHETGALSLLDYGSGKGEQYGEPYYLGKSWGIEVECYDPGYPKFSRLPQRKFDGVLCCDVMEHIPEDAIDFTLQQIFSLAKLFVFFVITTVPAKKILPDGRNCHVTVKPEEWWRNKIARFSEAGILVSIITKGDDDG